MRIALLGVLVLVGCGRDRGANEIDAPPAPIDARTVDAIDAQLEYCAPGTGTASVTTSTGGASTTYTQLHAGAIWLIGPVAPAAHVAHGDSTASLLFMNRTEPLPRAAGWCCGGPDPTCCDLEGLVVDTDPLPKDNEVGTHVARMRGFQDTTFRVMGTITITTFVSPFEQAPGRIAGSVSATDGNKSVSGTFDNTFCEALLAGTI